VDEIYKDGLHDFYFKLHGHKHVFQCAASERDAWVDAFKEKMEEAKKLAKTIPESQGYKDVYEKLGKKKQLFSFLGGARLPSHTSHSIFFCRKFHGQVTFML
jgi:hypothetical protein